MPHELGHQCKAKRRKRKERQREGKRKGERGRRGKSFLLSLGLFHKKKVQEIKNKNISKINNRKNWKYSFMFFFCNIIFDLKKIKIFSLPSFKLMWRVTKVILKKKIFRLKLNK